MNLAISRNQILKTMSLDNKRQGEFSMFIDYDYFGKDSSKKIEYLTTEEEKARDKISSNVEKFLMKKAEEVSSGISDLNKDALAMAIRAYSVGFVEKNLFGKYVSVGQAEMKEALSEFAECRFSVNKQELMGVLSEDENEEIEK